MPQKDKLTSMPWVAINKKNHLQVEKVVKFIMKLIYKKLTLRRENLWDIKIMKNRWKTIWKISKTKYYQLKTKLQQFKNKRVTQPVEKFQRIEVYYKLQETGISISKKKELFSLHLNKKVSCLLLNKKIIKKNMMRSNKEPRVMKKSQKRKQISIWCKKMKNWKVLFNNNNSLKRSIKNGLPTKEMKVTTWIKRFR